MAFTVEAAARTDIGLVRRSNQDAFGLAPELGLYLVCDGMGGVAGGEIASSLAVEAFLAVSSQELEVCPNSSPTLTAQTLQRAVAAANRAVLARAQWDTAYRGMGTTLVAARLCDGHLTLINVGDSRAYLIRDGQATQLTEDHSYVAERVRLGLMDPAEAQASTLQSVITRAIGADPDVHPDLYELTLDPGDTVLLASDGLTRYVAAHDLAATILAASNPDEACQNLIALANHHGGQDNITCILLRLNSNNPNLEP